MPDTIVDMRSILIGRLNTDQSLYVHGVFEGDLQVTNTVFIDRDGQVSADVTAEHVVVQGTVVGNICAEQVVIYASGKVWGDVCAKTLYVEAGGFLRGKVIVPSESEPKLFSQSSESYDDLGFSPQPLPDDDLVVELEVAARNSPPGDDLTDQLAHVIIEQHAPQQSDIGSELDQVQVISDQFATDMKVAQSQVQVAQPDTQLVEKEIEIALLPADPDTDQDEVEPQSQVYTAYCLVCRAYRRIEGARQVTLPNGHLAIKGRCAVCDIRFLEPLDL